MDGGFASQRYVRFGRDLRVVLRARRAQLVEVGTALEFSGVGVDGHALGPRLMGAGGRVLVKPLGTLPYAVHASESVIEPDTP